MNDLPKVRVLETLVVDGATALESAGSNGVVLGQVQLGQRPGRDSAEENHITVEYTPDLGFSLRSIATNRRLGLIYEKNSISERDYVLQNGDSFILGGRQFLVSKPTESSLVLTDAKTSEVLMQLPRAYYSESDEAPNWYDWMSYSASIGGRIDHNPASWGQKFTSRNLAELLIARDAAPAIVLAMPFLQPNAIQLAYVDGLYLLSLRAARSVAVCPAQGGCFELGRQRWPLVHPELGNLRAIIAGRTRYDVSVDNEQLSFAPTDRIHWLDKDDVSELAASLPDSVSATLANEQRIALYFKRGMPDQTTNAITVQLNAHLLATAQSFLEMDRSVQGWISISAALLMMLIYVLLLNDASVPRLFLRLPAMVLLALIIPPGLRTLSALPDFAPLEVFSLILVISLLFKRLAALLFGLRKLTPKNLFKRSEQLSLFSKSDEMHFGFELGLIALAIVTLYFAQPVEFVALPGYDTGAAVLSTFVLFTLAGVALTVRYRSPLLLAFWLALLVIIASGIIALAKLAFGQDMSRFVNLFHRHLTVVGVIAGGAVWFSSIPTKTVIAATRRILFLVSRDVKLSPFQVVTGIIPLGLCAILILPEIFISTPPVLGYFEKLDIPLPLVRLLSFIVVAAISGIAVLFFWRGHLAKSSDYKTRWLKWLYRPISLLSLWFLVPSLFLAAVVFITPETGIAGLQPSELTKTWLAFLFALLLARWVQAKAWRMPFEQGRSRFGLLLTCFVVAGFFALGSYINFDLSPAAIVIFMALSMGLVLFLEWVRSKLSGKVAIGLFVGVGIILWAVDSKFDFLDAFILAACGLLILPVLNNQGLRRQFHTSPWLLRNIAARRHKPAFIQLVKNKVRSNQRQVVLSIISAFVIGMIALQSMSDLNKVRDIESYRDYDVTLLGVSIPSTPLERVLSYIDARLPSLNSDLGTIGAGNIVDYPDLSLQVRESREIVAASGCGLSNGLLSNDQELQSPVPEAPTSLVARLGNVFLSLTTIATEHVKTLCGEAELPFPKEGPLDSVIVELPAVQDDFAPALLVSVLGVDGARLLLVAQIVMIAALMSLCFGVSSQVRQLSSFRGVGLLGAIFLGNLSFVFVIQITMSWSNMLGLLPVVGQPMTFISLGASHHLFFAFPLVLSALLCAALSQGLTEAVKPRQALITGAALKRHIYEN